MPDTGQVPNLIQDRRKSVVWAILGAIILGAIGSGLWDMLAKPGLGTVGRLLLNIVTLGSKTIRDAAYSSAALNPTAMPVSCAYSRIALVITKPTGSVALVGSLPVDVLMKSAPAIMATKLARATLRRVSKSPAPRITFMCARPLACLKAEISS